MWDLPGPGIEPTSLGMAGIFSTSAPQGSPVYVLLVISPTIYLLSEETETKQDLSGPEAHLLTKIYWCQTMKTFLFSLLFLGMYLERLFYCP